MANSRTDFFPTVEGRFVWTFLSAKKTRDFLGKDLLPAEQFYETAFLIPKAAGDWTQAPYIGPAAIAAKVWEAASGLAEWKGQWKPGARWPIEDGDLAKDLDKNSFLRGHWKITPWSDYPPKVVDASGQDILPGMGNQLKSGDYGRVSINAWAYVTGSGGVGLGIEGAMKTRDGDPIGGGGARSPEQMFGAMAPGAAPPLPLGFQQGQYAQTQGYHAAGTVPVAPAWATAPAPTPPTAGPAPGYAPPYPSSQQYDRPAPVLQYAPAGTAPQPPGYPPQGAMPPVPPPPFGSR